jgi:hypothetical protein
MALRTARAHGMSLSAFYALPDNEQFDLLAYDDYRQKQIAALYDGLTAGKYVDSGAVAQALLAGLE